MNKTALGRRINLARKELGITGEQLAELCDINATYLRQIETGRKVPSLPMFVTICQKLHTTPSYLLQDSLDVGRIPTETILQVLTAASPAQLRLISAMLEGALQVLNEQEKP